MHPGAADADVGPGPGDAWDVAEPPGHRVGPAGDAGGRAAVSRLRDLAERQVAPGAEAEAVRVRPDVAGGQHARRRERLPGLAARGDSAESLGHGARGDAERVDRAAESPAGGTDARVLVRLGSHQLPAAAGSERAVFSEGVVHRSASAVYAAAVLLRPLPLARTCRAR